MNFPGRSLLIGLVIMVSLGGGAIAAVVHQPDLLKPLVKAGIPLRTFSTLPFLGDAVRAAESPEITPAQLVQQLNNTKILLVDVRTKAEFERGHLPGAMHLPIDQIESGDAIKQIQMQLSDRQLVTYCHSGQRSHRALAKLRQAGITGQNLTGGIVAWRQQIDPQMPEPKP